MELIPAIIALSAQHCSSKTVSFLIQATMPEPINASSQSSCMWISHTPGRKLPLLSARPAVTFPATEALNQYRLWTNDSLCIGFLWEHVFQVLPLYQLCSVTIWSRYRFITVCLHVSLCLSVLHLKNNHWREIYITCYEHVLWWNLEGNKCWWHLWPWPLTLRATSVFLDVGISTQRSM